MIDRIFDALTQAIQRVLALAFIAAVCINFINVIGRYAFGYTFLGADEVQIYIMIWMAFLGAAVVTWRDQHLRMDVLVRMFPTPVQQIVRALRGLAFLILASFVALQSFRYSARMFALGQTSDMARVPMWIPHGAVALGFALMALMMLWSGAKAMRNRRLALLTSKPRTDEGAKS